jgi:hypothetical protein
MTPEMTYRTPVRDLLFGLSGIVEVEALFSIQGFGDLDLDTVRAVLEGAADFAENVLAPLNSPGDLVAVEAADRATAWITERRAEADKLAGASAYLKMMGDTLGGWALARGVLAVAAGRVGDAAYGDARIRLAVCYAQTVLAQVPGQLPSICAGAAGLQALGSAALASA